MNVRAQDYPAAFCGIAVMAKASYPGQAKTRLCPPLTFEEAAALNTAFLKDIADNLIAVSTDASSEFNGFNKRWNFQLSFAGASTGWPSAVFELPSQTPRCFLLLRKSSRNEPEILPFAFTSL
jgi:hypothetical protein